MLLKTKRVMYRGVTSPITYGTAFMRISLSIIIALSSVAAMIYVVALGTDELYTFHNEENIYYTPTSNPSGGAKSRTLLLPQLDVTVGLVTACVGHSCFRRVGCNGVHSLITNTLGNQTFTTGVAASLQRQLKTEFIFGYDTGVHCGSSVKKVEHMAEFAYVVYVLSLVFFLGTCIASMFFYQLVGDTDVLAGTPSLDRDSNAVNVGDLGLPGIYVTCKLKRHLRHEGPMLTSVLMLSGLAFIFSVCGMGVTIAVQASTTKCGTSVCASFESSMSDFLAELARLNVSLSSSPAYSCRTGVSLSLFIAGFVLGVVCFFLACFLFGWFSCSQRRKVMINLFNQLYRLAEVQGLIGTIAGNGYTSFPLVQSRRMSEAAGARSVALSVGSDIGERGSGGGNAAYCNGTSNVPSEAQKPSVSASSFTGYKSLQARSVGARIGVYRMLKQFMSTEDQARQNVVAQEKLEFFSLLAMRESLWYDEEVCLLHELTLNWFIGPPLDLCVLETNERQLIIDNYNTWLNDFFKNIAGGFVASGEPTQTRECGSSLPVAESARWSQQVGHWQQVQAIFAPLLRQSASYTCASVPVVDSDRFLSALDRLRGSVYEEGAFTLSASPLFAQSNTGTLTQFENNTSLSSNVFSDPSFAVARCEDFTVPTDNVRTHLVNSAYPMRTPPQPPPRLRALPQHNETKQLVNTKGGGTRCRRHSGTTSINNGSIRPHGRTPSSQARFPALTPPGAGDEANSFTSAASGNGNQLHGAERPFSSRDGTSSGCTPFQAAFAAHNASLAGSPSSNSNNTYGVVASGRGDGLANGAALDRSAPPRVNSAQSATFPTGDSWRFSKPR